MYYVYFLKTKLNTIYIGCTNNLKRRLEQHKQGKVLYTKSSLPIKLVYCEVYTAKEDAYRREASLKQHGQAWRRLRERLHHSLLG